MGSKVSVQWGFPHKNLCIENINSGKSVCWWVGRGVRSLKPIKFSPRRSNKYRNRISSDVSERWIAIRLMAKRFVDHREEAWEAGEWMDCRRVTCGCVRVRAARNLSVLIIVFRPLIINPLSMGRNQPYSFRKELPIFLDLVNHRFRRQFVPRVEEVPIFSV